MPSVSIICPDNPTGPADIALMRREKQQKRNDPEAIILKEYKKKYSEVINMESPKMLDELIDEYCEKLGVNFKQFLHKLEIFYGRIDDDEIEWRKQKYGVQKQVMKK